MMNKIKINYLKSSLPFALNSLLSSSYNVRCILCTRPFNLLIITALCKKNNKTNKQPFSKASVNRKFVKFREQTKKHLFPEVSKIPKQSN